MRREDMADLTAFIAVAETGSFTQAARQLGLSQPALSQIIRRLEDRLDLRLLDRTTRSVAPTQAGQRLLQSLGPMLREMDQRIADLSDLRDRPMGHIRITSVEHAARTLLYPRLAPVLKANPDVTVEIVLDYGLADVVADRFDAGVRLGEQVDQDMIAVRLGPPTPVAIVAAPAYLAAHSPPRAPEDLVDPDHGHRAINLHLPTSRTHYPWPLSKGGREVQVRLEGPLAFNSLDMILMAARDGLGLAMVPVDMVQADLAQGRLVQVLKDWTQPLPPYHLYYPSRRHPTVAFKLVVEALRHQPGRDV